MANRLDSLLEEIKALEQAVLKELEQKKEELSYEITKRTIRFKEEVIEHHKTELIRWYNYLRHAKLRNIATAPIIWLNLIPALMLDMIATIYQLSCFPIYGIPRVKRHEYIIIDRHFLKYLNVIEKLNCIYCGYFNGVLAYVTEIAARTEQYWCPIKHASKLKATHSRYVRFFDFGDSENFHQKFNEIRKQFDDIDKE